MRRGRGRARSRTLGRPDAPANEELLSQIRLDVERLYESVLPYSIVLDQAVRNRLVDFAAELIRWNDRLNLLARTDVHNVVRKHVAASLGVLLVAQPRSGERWIDVGTGGGFPGLILHATCPGIDMSLLESSRKRCLFLENVLRRVGLPPAKVLAMRAETHIAQGRGREAYDVLTTRAVAALSQAIEAFGPLLAVGGRFITFKGPRWADEVERATSEDTLERCRFRLLGVTRIPWTQGHLLVLEKSG